MGLYPRSFGDGTILRRSFERKVPRGSFRNFHFHSDLDLDPGYIDRTGCTLEEVVEVTILLVLVLVLVDILLVVDHNFVDHNLVEGIGQPGPGKQLVPELGDCIRIQ